MTRNAIHPLTRKQTKAVAKAIPERRDALEAAFHRQNDAERIFVLKCAAGEYDRLDQYAGKL